MYHQFPEYFDSTSRKDFDICQKKFYYSWVRRLKKKGKSIHLVFGGAFAAGVETVRKEYYGKGASLYDALPRGMHELIVHWGDYENEGPASKKTLETCILALFDYFDHYNPAEDVLSPAILENEPAVEFSFGIPLLDCIHPETGRPIIYSGRFDMLGIYKKSLYVVDEKTTGQLGASWANQFKLSSQLTGYCWAASQYGYKVQGAIIRGMGIYANSFGHSMVIEQRPQWMIDRWKEQLVRNINSAIEAYKSGYYDYSIDTGCTTFGSCPFLDLCTSPQPEKWIPTYYEHNDWNPLAKGA